MTAISRMEQNDINSQHLRQRDWQIVLTAGIGLFLSTLDIGIVNVALPTLGSKFGAPITTMAWVITLYLLTLSVTIVFFGRLSDGVGRVKIYVLGLTVFALASILCGVSQSAHSLILFRGLQGIGAAMLQATATALITTYIPTSRRGQALGLLAMMIGLGPVLGPSVGGLLLSFVSWRWIFWLNIPICAAGLWGCKWLRGNALIAYIIHELHVPRPIVQLTLFRRGSFIAPICSVTVLGLSTAIAFIIPPYFLEQVAHLPPWQVGVVNLAAPLGLVLFARLSGKLMPNMGTTKLTVYGLILMFIALGTIALTTNVLDVSVLSFLLFIYGIGAGLFVPPNLSTIMSAVDQNAQGTIGAIQRMVQNVGIAIGTSVAATMMHHSVRLGTGQLMLGFRDAWLLATIATFISLAITLGAAFLRQYRR